MGAPRLKCLFRARVDPRVSPFTGYGTLTVCQPTASALRGRAGPTNHWRDLAAVDKFTETISC